MPFPFEVLLALLRDLSRCLLSLLFNLLSQLLDQTYLGLVVLREDEFVHDLQLLLEFLYLALSVARNVLLLAQLILHELTFLVPLNQILLKLLYSLV